ncbi:flagellar filament capping protein FliD [Paenibacillus solani]|uniref:flagellar filament capping protein FliD n=1 Tax=Paenibacillus solani TaxID=1705565 RepID=UPI003D2848A9
MNNISGIRFSGIASGLDTDAIIKQLMTVEKYPLNKLNQQKQLTIWKRDSYREVNTLYSSLRTLADGLRLESNFNKTSVASSDNSVVTVQSNDGSTTANSYSIKVNQLAASATIAGQAMGSGIDLNAAGLTGTDIEFKINGKPIKVTSTSTMQSVIDDINKSGAEVTASFDQTNGRLFLTSKQTGEKSEINIEDSTGVLASKFGLVGSDGKAITFQAGKDAIVEMNGTVMTMPNNSFTMNGVSFFLKGTSTSAVTVEASRDVQGMVDKITAFVEKYNELIDKVRGKLDEKKNRDYTPLTDEQKEAMSEKQIELWETKAKSGILYRDSMLESVLTTLRQSFMNEVEGLDKGKNTLSYIGIGTAKNTKDAYLENGKLHIDTEKLKSALINDPDGVVALFTQSPAGGTKTQLGYAERIKKDLDAAISSLAKKIGSGSSENLDNSLMGKELRTLNTRIYDMQDRLVTIETRYYKQFTAMEKAIQKLNSQGSWLSQQLGN